MSHEVIGIGNAIVDILALVDDEFITAHQLEKSSMRLCTRDDQQLILDDISDFTATSGGSAANTISSLAGLGLETGFIGTIANDEWGTSFKSSLTAIGAETYVNVVDNPAVSSGTSVILVTPDSERTMNTHLGAAADITTDSIKDDVISSSGITYVEGYLYDTDEQKHAVEKAFRIAHDNSQRVALTLSDSFCVVRHREDFLSLIKNVDIVFANESEICTLWDIEQRDVTHDDIRAHQDMCAPVTVITKSERGCTVLDNNELISVDAIETELVDLTGAGDQFAAGYLYGVSHGWSTHRCAHAGIVLATHVISQMGPRIETKDLIDLRDQLN